jgi:hypothetical protein
MSIEIENVIKTYSGETGCACGCTGTYAYMSGYDPGYEVESNERTVKMRVRKINAAIAFGQPVHIHRSYNGVSVYELENDLGTRVVRAYVQDGIVA